MHVINIVTFLKVISCGNLSPGSAKVLVSTIYEMLIICLTLLNTLFII